MSDENLTVVVFGASGDLARIETFPALHDLYQKKLLPKATVICGYSRSELSDDEFKEKIRPDLVKKAQDESTVDEFLDLCVYRITRKDSGQHLKTTLSEITEIHGLQEGQVENRLFYLAIPPFAFASVATTIHEEGESATGFNRIVIEKPFGKDTASAKTLQSKLSGLFDESYYYRMDHYLGKEMVQNLLTVRFGNIFLEPLMNKKHVESILFNFDEDFGTKGRGGYFDDAGMIRDVMQNHVMQVVALLCMDKPKKLSGEGAAEAIRDAKVKVLKKVSTWKYEDTILGQYSAANGKPGYLDDDTVPDDSKTETFACVKFQINNKRWKGVNFVMKAGKALTSSGTEVRILFKDTMNTGASFGEPLSQNEFIVRMNYGYKISMGMNIKRPGMEPGTVSAKMVLDYDEDLPDLKAVKAYTRLLRDVINGDQTNFVRSDEVMEAWRIVSPLLHRIESDDDVEPIIYEFGSHGPDKAYNMIRDMGFDI